MPAVHRDFRVRIAARGATTIDGSVELPLGIDTLADVPVVTGQIVRPLAGATEIRPFAVLALDRDGALSALFSVERRYAALGRLVDVQYRDLPAGEWVTYGTGRISSIDEADGPGRFRIEISDESWIARSARIFDAADTTQLWPAGIRGMWDAFLPAPLAKGVRRESQANRHRIRVQAGGLGRSHGREITAALVRWIQSRIADEIITGPGATGGNFGPLRLHYAGVDYEVLSFATSINSQELLETLEDPEIHNPDRGNETWQAQVWIYSTTVPPAEADCFLHAPTAPPESGMPLHVGAAIAGHPWAADGRIHPATLTRRIWDAIGVRYDEASLAAIEADTSLPHLSPRVTAVPDDAEQWCQENVWAPLSLVVLRDGQGRRKLVDLRLPSVEEMDIDSLPVLDAGNTEPRSWRLLGTEAVNAIAWTYEHRVAAAGARHAGSEPELDNIWPEERTLPAIEGDTIEHAGRRELNVRFMAAGRAGRPGLLPGIAAALAQELLDTYQDGASRGLLEVGRTLAETLEEGELVLLDQDSLRGLNPETGTRGGQRVVRVMAITRWPAHAEIEYLDVGPTLQPIPAPAITIEQDATDLDLVHVTISDMPAGALAQIEVAFTDSAAAPDEWPIKRTGVAAGVHTFSGAPGEGYGHARARIIGLATED